MTEEQDKETVAAKQVILALAVAAAQAAETYRHNPTAGPQLRKIAAQLMEHISKEDLLREWGRLHQQQQAEPDNSRQKYNQEFRKQLLQNMVTR